MDKKGKSFIVKNKFLPAWFEDPDKRAYDNVDFQPRPLECPEKTFNLWNGFAIEKCDVEPKNCERILDLINTLCNFQEETYGYFMDWLAQMVQFPAVKSGTAIVLKSEPGGGKSTLSIIFRKMMGQSYVGETANPAQDIFGTHGNIHIGKILTFLDEVKSGDTVKNLGQLKNLITSEKCNYNEKGVKLVEVMNCSRFLFTTNESIPLAVDDNDRRYGMIECSDKYCLNFEFWIDFYKNVVEDQGIIKGFFNTLMERDVSNRDWMSFPQTELRSEMIKASLHPIIYFLDKFIRSHKYISEDIIKITPTKLFAVYKEYCSKHNINVTGNASGFGSIFRSRTRFEKVDIGIEIKKSNGIRKYEMDKYKVFEWLKSKDYTMYDALPKCDITYDSEDEL